MSEVSQRRPAVIGLTGGIGSGKSSAASIFASLHVPVLDLDKVGHAVLREDEEVRRKLERILGEEVLRPDGGIDRTKIAEKTFASVSLTEQLNRIMHPAIWKREEQWLANQHAPYVIVEAAVLIESGGIGRMDRVIVVLADEAIRKRRVLERSGKIDEEMFDAIVARQCSDDTRVGYADDIIHNNGDMESFRREIEMLHGELVRQFDS